ncbi:MAG: hypothetical protein K6E40_04725 [Desulfovibrio sp.]|nr:hypothetical protein [Desulfovibrio sp.]
MPKINATENYEKYSKGQLVAVVEIVWCHGKTFHTYTLGVILRLYKISALVRSFYKNEQHVSTVRYSNLIPAQKAFPWMKRYNARLIYDAQD